MARKGMSPEELINKIKGKNLKITPVIEIQNELGLIENIMCDCSGCNNDDVWIDLFCDD